MSAERWERSLCQLYATAHCLEAGIDAAPIQVQAAPPRSLVPAVEPARSTLRALAGVAVHSAVTVGVLLGGFAAGDPYLPHAARPHVADRAVVLEGTSESDAYIPPFEANRP